MHAYCKSFGGKNKNKLQQLFCTNIAIQIFRKKLKLWTLIFFLKENSKCAVLLLNNIFSTWNLNYAYGFREIKVTYDLLALRLTESLFRAWSCSNVSLSNYQRPQQSPFFAATCKRCKIKTNSYCTRSRHDLFEGLREFEGEHHI